METLREFFKNPEQIVDDIYSNAGFEVCGWGSLSRGYGGGITQEQAIRLLWTGGFIEGIWRENKPIGAKIMKAINDEIIKMGIGDKKPPFKEEIISQYL